MKPKIISKTASYGNQTWRINFDGSYSALAFGSFLNQSGLRHGWINVDKEKVPIEIKDILNGSHK